MNIPSMWTLNSNSNNLQLQLLKLLVYWPFSLHSSKICNTSLRMRSFEYLNPTHVHCTTNIQIQYQIPDYQIRYHLSLKTQPPSPFRIDSKKYNHCSKSDRKKRTRQFFAWFAHTTKIDTFHISQRIQLPYAKIDSILFLRPRSRHFFWANHLCRSEETTICHDFSTPTIRSTPMLFIKSANNDTPQCFVLCHHRNEFLFLLFFSHFMPFALTTIAIIVCHGNGKMLVGI